MKKITRLIAALLLVISIFSAMTSCDAQIKEIIGSIIGDSTQDDDKNQEKDPPVTELSIKNGEKITLTVGDVIQLHTNLTDSQAANIEWSASNGSVTVSGGTVSAISEGTCMVYARYGKLYDKIIIQVVLEGADSGDDGDKNDDIGNSGNVGDANTDIDPDVDPYEGISKSEFYSDYTPSVGYWDSYYRSLHGLMSGTIGAQDQKPTISEYQPMYNGLYVRNSVGIYGAG